MINDPKPTREEFDVFSVMTMGPTEVTLQESSWDKIIDGAPMEVVLDSGVKVDLVRAQRKVEGPICLLVGWFKDKENRYGREELQSLIDEHFKNRT